VLYRGTTAAHGGVPERRSFGNDSSSGPALRGGCSTKPAYGAASAKRLPSARKARRKRCAAPVAEAQARVELVREGAAVDGLAAGARAGGVAALREEAVYDAVEDAAIVVALQAQLHKVAHRLRTIQLCCLLASDMGPRSRLLVRWASKHRVSVELAPTQALLQ